MSILKNLKNIDGFLAALSLALLIAVITIQVVLRFVFLKPLMGAEELTRYLLICSVMFPLGYAERTGSTIVMEEFLQKMPRIIRKFFDIIISMLSTVVYAIVALSAFSVLKNNVANRTATLEMPFWLFFLPTVVGMTAITLINIYRLILKIANKDNSLWASR